MIEGITTPKDHIEFLKQHALWNIEAHGNDVGQRDDMLKSHSAAVDTMNTLYLHYIGVIALLSNVSGEVSADNRGLIEDAIVDAIALGAPLNYKRTTNGIDIGVNAPVEEDLEV